jgi:hypothetical protein
MLRSLELLAVIVDEPRDVESDVESLRLVVLKALEFDAVRVGEPRDVENDVESLWPVVLVLVFEYIGKMVL